VTAVILLTFHQFAEVGGGQGKVEECHDVLLKVLTQHIRLHSSALW
jgi:hypothetical protein